PPVQPTLRLATLRAPSAQQTFDLSTSLQSVTSRRGHSPWRWPMGRGDDNGLRHVGTLAMSPTVRLLATHVALAIMFGHLNTARHAGFGEPNREPAATDSERRKATPGDYRCS